MERIWKEAVMIYYNVAGLRAEIRTQDL